MMTQPKRYKLPSNNKDTRWDRIRKRHNSHVSTNFKSDAVKRFIEIDYIGRHNQNMLNGDNNLETSLDPVMVMNLRHEMFKKIPRKLPLATVAYSKNLQQCKNHNIAVEDHYIENQLNQFRKQLQKQREQNKMPVKKLNSLLIDNTDIINSLESTHKHIEDFYQTPIDSLQEVHDLFTDEFEKHNQMIRAENLSQRGTDLDNECLQNNLENLKDIDINIEEQENEWNELNIQKDSNFKSEMNVVEIPLDFIKEGRNELHLNSEIYDSQVERNELRMPSPLENTDEVLKSLGQVTDHHTDFNLRCVRFDDAINVCNLKREASISSNSSEGINSVLSDLAEEALKELQMEEEMNLVESLEQNSRQINKYKESLTLNGCVLHTSEQPHNDFFITGKPAAYVKSPLIDDVVSTHSKNPSEESEHFSNGEQSKIIENLFQTHIPNKKNILRKYFYKWIHYTAMEKIEGEHVYAKSDRVKKINIFLNKIRIKKTPLKCRQKMAGDSEFDKDDKKTEKKLDAMKDIKMNKKYQNKIKIQQDIIDLQRLKLERQERIIMELKLHKLSEEAKEAREEIKNELKSVIRSGDAKSKAKAKCLQIIGNLKDEEDDNLNSLQGRSLLLPRFLQNMQERALERSIRHEQVKQRRMQQEAEREAQKSALEEAKRLEDEEAKRLRLEALKEKRRQEKLAKIIKERERQKYKENQSKAENFYKRLLLKRIGMEGFKRLLDCKREILKKCEELRRSLYRRTYFKAWFTLYKIINDRRNQKADELYEKILKRKYNRLWLQYVYEERSKLNVAVDYNEFKITEVMFRRWLAYAKRMKMIETTKIQKAILHHEWHLKWKVVDCWQRLPQILQLEKDTEERRQRWRLKIWELLPDYKPNRDDFI